MRTAAIHSGARRIYGILGTAIVVRTRGGTPVRVGVFVDVCVGVEDAHAVKPLECRGPTQYYLLTLPHLEPSDDRDSPHAYNRTLRHSRNPSDDALKPCLKLVTE